MSASTSPAPKGMTAQPIRARMKVTIGARRKMTLLERSGITVSLRKSFTPSAIGWRSPNGPTVIGPCRSCMAAITLRSA
jgi:hypothetical protein